MSTGLFPEADDDALYLSRSNPDEPLGCFSAHPFHLDDQDWPSVEHYFQATKFENLDYREKIRLAKSPVQARKLGGTWLRKTRANWKKIQITVMTRGLYTKCKTYPEVAQALLATQQLRLVENSNYDYYWGCGRDRRGDNHYGKALMNVRAKLRKEAQTSEH